MISRADKYQILNGEKNVKIQKYMELQENIYDKELAEQIEKAGVRVPVNTAIVMHFNLFLCC